MKKRTLVLAAATVGAVRLLAGPAAAGNGYGKEIKSCFGATYGQAKNAAWEAGHASAPALGAKQTFLAHSALCVGDE